MAEELKQSEEEKVELKQQYDLINSQNYSIKSNIIAQIKKGTTCKQC